MELVSAIVKKINVSTNVQPEITLLRQLLPVLVRQERMLKIKLKRYATTVRCNQKNDELVDIKKSRYHYARLKRKVVLIQKKYANQPQKKILLLLRFVKRFTKLMKLRHCIRRHVFTQQNGHNTRSWNFGPPTNTCQYCGAILWYEERTKKTKQTTRPKFSFCCMEGRVRLPLMSQPPPYLKYLLSTDSGQLGISFRKNIRVYNSMFAFTSMGGRVDRSINRSKGPYVFRMSGQNYHHIGSLLPESGKKPQFAQLYIYDTENEIHNRMNSLLHEEVDPKIVQGLSEMLDEHNILAKTFRMARDRYKQHPESVFRLRLLSDRTRDGRQYNIPTASEVAGLIIGDLTDENFQRDVIVEHRKNGLQRITDLHPSFMSMTYPLIHPYGEDGYRLGILLTDVIKKTFAREKLTMRQFYCFRIQQRLNEAHALLQAGRLLQQYIVDGYMAIEEERFRYIRNNQKKLRADLFSGLMDAIVRGDSDCSMIGKTIILPSSHTGGPRYRVQNYQDAMAICRWAGYPDLFLTFTCNPKWPEINEMLCLIGQESDDNRVDIICRVFQIKLFQLMQDLKKNQPFGKIIACLYTIEFQKRGLPHGHILLFLHPTLKSPFTDHIDRIIAAEISNLEVDPCGYNAVKNFMMHGPCGELNPHCPCMRQGKCTKHFPKKFNDRTTFDSDGFPIYRRRNTGTQVKKNGANLDNRYVVPYNRDLLVKYDAHINVELCNYSRSVKYLFKYVHKGSDRATATIESTNTDAENDEIKKYLDCRYISATEACWRIFKFDIHYRKSAVERLPFHLEGQNIIIFEEEKRAESVISRPDIEKTKFT
ncbi:uncharacterized protein [Nicotiana tomentosiformis]|uniref:uncharacterized protein isoform X2 n=1 Tax=Nicotiana tomentosiformis TaxID=4098 RepID=UPI00388C824C